MTIDTKKKFLNDYNMNNDIPFAFFNARTLLDMLELNSQLSS